MLKNKLTKIKKSQIYMLGSLLIFLGLITLSFNHIKVLKGNVFENMKQLIAEAQTPKQSAVTNVPIVENKTAETPVPSQEETEYKINWDKYVGILEIPKIGLKRGFYNVGSRYNSIEYNVTVISGSNFPDVKNGNLMLIAHSGDAYISYFRYLYRLRVGDLAYVTYNGTKYEYRIVNIYNVAKTGVATIERNYDATTLTLITCTYNSDTEQTIYIAEAVE